jgi:hypothetical protein
MKRVFSSIFSTVCMMMFTSSAHAGDGGIEIKIEEIKRLPETRELLCRNVVSTLTSPHLVFAENYTRFKGEELYRALTKLYLDVAWLRYKVVGSPEDGEPVPHPKSPSLLVFGQKASEFDRAVIGLENIQQVFADDYEGLTAGQNPAVRLTRESFNDWRELTLRVLKTPEDLDAMIAYLAMHDLGKVKTFTRIVEGLTARVDPDHDVVLIEGLRTLGEEPIISPSFDRLSHKYRSLILRGMIADFNMGQFAQGENVPASLLGLKNLDSEAFEFYLVHLLFDVAGAGGAKNPVGAAAMIQPVYDGFRTGGKILRKIYEGVQVTELYDMFLRERAKTLGLPMGNPRERAIVRLALMSRAGNPKTAQEVVNVFNSLPENAKAILVQELNVSGVDDGFATLPYYAPALFAESKATLVKVSHPQAMQESMRLIMMVLAEVFHEARQMLKTRTGSGVFTVNFEQVARAIKDPAVLKSLLNFRVELQPYGDDATALLKPVPSVNENKFPRMKSLDEIPGRRMVPIGIGGGSDVIQAVQLGFLARDFKDVPAVISLRSLTKDKSSELESIARTHPEALTIVDRGIFLVHKNSSHLFRHVFPSNRALEDLAADEIPTYLVIDEQDGAVAGRISRALEKIGQVETIVAVDTGGDALYSTIGVDPSKASPDMDVRMLKALDQLEVEHKMTANIAVGVDSPDNAEQILHDAKAIFYSTSGETARRLLENYERWKLDGTNEERYGKTPLAFQAALKNAFGLVVLPLPQKVVLDFINPWNPFVHIQSSMRGIFFVKLSDHLQAIKSK